MAIPLPLVLPPKGPWAMVQAQRMCPDERIKLTAATRTWASSRLYMFITRYYG